MGQILTRVEWYGGKGADAAVVLTDITKINFGKGIEANVNTCEITVTNPLNKVTSGGKVVNKYVDDEGLLKFDEEDFIKVFIRQTETQGTIDTSDTSADLAAIVAIISSFKETRLKAKTVLIGEVGLGSELRPVSNINLRLKEASSAGFKECYIPSGNLKEVNIAAKSLKVTGADSVKDVLDFMKSIDPAKGGGI